MQWLLLTNCSQIQRKRTLLRFEKDVLLTNCDRNYNTDPRELELQAHRIYYHHKISETDNLCGRKIWLPEIGIANPDDETETGRRRRAETMYKRAIRNEQRKKSEYAWEADAWASIFEPMRDDTSLEM